MTSASFSESSDRRATAPNAVDTGEYIARLTRILSDGFANDGFGEQRFALIHVRERDDFPETFELGLRKDLDGHPVDVLLGFVCPAEWAAFGLSHVGWSSPMGAVRPSRHPQRERVRITTLVHRDGAIASVLRFENGKELSDTSECHGMIPDVLRRALGVPTPPPALPLRAFMARLWLESVLREARRRRPMTWKDVAALEPHPSSESWSDLRWSVVTARRSLDEVTPEIAAWMDDGMFARWSAPDDSLFHRVERVIGPSAMRRVSRRLEEWQVL